MPTRLDSVVVDSADPSSLGAWWAAALGWIATEQRWTEPDGSPGFEVTVEPPDGDLGVPLTIGPVSDPKVGLNRVHLDLRSGTLDDQSDLVARLTAHGARQVDVGQGVVPFVVLADPEGNELCVLEPRAPYQATGAVAAIVVKALDPPSLGRFWASATGWGVTQSEPGFAALRAPGDRGPFLEFVATREPHAAKNRWHLDVRPGPDDDQRGEVARLVALGARPVDVGQSKAPPGSVTWVVLADPEGNEFCVLRPG